MANSSNNSGGHHIQETISAAPATGPDDLQWHLYPNIIQRSI